jgi:hypothetical protein
MHLLEISHLISFLNMEAKFKTKATNIYSRQHMQNILGKPQASNLVSDNTVPDMRKQSS